MNLPTIFDWLETLDFLRGAPAAYGVLVTAVLILVAWDWRLMLLALAAQYLIASFLFVDLLDPRLVNVKVLTGLFLCLILYMTARQASWRQPPVHISETEGSHPHRRGGTGIGLQAPLTTRLFRVFLAAMMVLVILTLAQRPAYYLPAVPRELNHINLAVYALAGMGILSVALTSEPLHVGMGLLTFFTGFELFYSALEQSVAVLAAIAVANLLVTLAIAFLTQAHHALPEQVN